MFLNSGVSFRFFWCVYKPHEERRFSVSANPPRLEIFFRVERKVWARFNEVYPLKKNLPPLHATTHR